MKKSVIILLILSAVETYDSVQQHWKMGKSTLWNQRNHSIPMMHAKGKGAPHDENQHFQKMIPKVPIDKILGSIKRQKKEEAAENEKDKMMQRIRELEARNQLLVRRGPQGEDRRVAELEDELRKQLATIQSYQDTISDLKADVRKLRTENDFLQAENATVEMELRAETDRLRLTERDLEGKNLKLMEIMVVMRPTSMSAKPSRTPYVHNE